MMPIVIKDNVRSKKPSIIITKNGDGLLLGKRKLNSESPPVEKSRLIRLYPSDGSLRHIHNIGVTLIKKGVTGTFEINKLNSNCLSNKSDEQSEISIFDYHIKFEKKTHLNRENLDSEICVDDEICNAYKKVKHL